MSCPTVGDITDPQTPEAKAALAAAVVTTRCRVNTDAGASISLAEARAIASATLAAYYQTFRRLSDGGGL